MKKISSVQRRHFVTFAISAVIFSAIIAAGCNRKGITDASGAPVVVATNPLNNATGVPLNATLSVIFNEEMDTTTFSTTSFNLKAGSSPVPGIVTFTDTTATFIPLDNLLRGRTYTATVTTDVTDAFGLKLPENYVWQFSTIGSTDTTDSNIEVVSAFPPDDSENISLSPRITANFSEVMNPSTVNEETFFLRQGTNRIEGSVRLSDNSAIFTPSRGLTYGSTYTATVTTGAESVNGRSLAANYSWRFTTIENLDNEAPEITSVEPEDDADEVVITASISATFSERINPSTINAATFTLREGRDTIEGSVEYSGTTATFVPEEELEFDEEYIARISDDVEDLAGNDLGRPFEWRFSTEEDNEAPEIIDTDPDNEADDVDTNVIITVTFSEAMNPRSINSLRFLLFEDGPGNSRRSIPGFVDYSGFTATLNPIGNLDENERYSVIISREVEDEAGNEMDEDFIWTFETGSDDDNDDD